MSVVGIGGNYAIGAATKCKQKVSENAQIFKMATRLNVRYQQEGRDTQNNHQHI